MAATTPTDYWNDSCSAEELRYAIDRGAVGATAGGSIRSTAGHSFVASNEGAVQPGIGQQNQAAAVGEAACASCAARAARTADRPIACCPGVREAHRRQGKQSSAIAWAAHAA